MHHQLGPDRNTPLRFHQHLVALEIAGFCVTKPLFGASAFERQSVGEGLKDRVEGLHRFLDWIAELSLDSSVKQVDSHGHLWREDVVQSAFVDTRELPTKIDLMMYRIWRDHWQSRGGSLQSLKQLLVQSQMDRVGATSGRLAQVQLLVWILFAVLAFSGVFWNMLEAVKGMLDQMQVQTHWILAMLIKIQSQPLWTSIVILLFATSLVVIFVLLKRLSKDHSSDPAHKFLTLSTRAGLHSANLPFPAKERSENVVTQESYGREADSTPSIPTNRAISPLLRWADQETQSASERETLLRTIEQVYWQLGQGLVRSRRPDGSWSLMLVGFVGGGLALGIGLMLFYSLLQLLQTVIDSTGMGK